ncbi:MAG TPA: cytochrome d ubiquinol oxidase subunit II [Polyangiaceae bacterium]|nr:cytochrome d ubiquinol oxidase subunit II [Polyangiaceae bacterium]
MTLWAEVLWLALGAGLVLYALTGGPDFGAGVWSLLARGPRKAAQRAAVHHAIAPIWEANHVWLIFVIVVLFSAFPRAFAAISIALHIPIALALLGIVFRGAAFAFHAYGIHTDRTRQAWSRVFYVSSILTPVLLGTIAGALGTGQIRVINGRVSSGFFAGWTTPFAWLVGAFTLALFATLAATYLCAETEDRALSDDFRWRAIVAELVTGMLAGLVPWRASSEAPQLYGMLMESTWTWLVQAATAASAITTILLLWVRELRMARFTCAAQAALVVAGWGLAMDRHFVLPDVSVSYSIGYAPVLPAFAIAFGGGALLLIPAFWYLLRVFKAKHHEP